MFTCSGPAEQQGSLANDTRRSGVGVCVCDIVLELELLHELKWVELDVGDRHLRL